MEAIHKQKAENIREKAIADQFEARRTKNKQSRERKIARREERLAVVSTCLADNLGLHTCDSSMYASQLLHVGSESSFCMRNASDGIPT